jgi:AhpD family alkylhydroperoxidase
MARLTPVSTAAESRRSAPSSLDAGNFQHLLANSAAAAQAYSHDEAALQSGLLTPQERVLLALTIAEIHGASYCLSFHQARALELGLSEDQIRQARRACSLNPRLNAVLRFAQTVVLQRGEISDAELQKARAAGLRDGLIGEVLANLALHVFTNYFNLVAQTELDFPPLKPGVGLS